MKTPKSVPFALPIPAPLGAMLAAMGYSARIMVARTDGLPIDADDKVTLRATVATLSARERKTMKVIRAAAKLLPANEAPFPVAGGGRASAPKGRAKPPRPPRTRGRG